jgi:hypothetical protein
MPDFGRVSLIDASPFDAATAYVSVRRPLLDDFAPHIFRTHDFGRTWTKIVDGIRADAYVNAVRADPVRRGLLYAGTNHGVWISYDDGDSWQPLNPGLPDLPIVSMIVERDELVISAHGRGFWILDDIAPLRQAAPDLASARARLLEPPSAIRSGPDVTLSWWLSEAADDARLQVLDAAGTVLRTFEPPDSAERSPAGGGGRGGGPSMPNEAGLNRLRWDLRTEPFTSFPGMILWGVRTRAPAVPPGEYTVRLTAAGATQTVPLRVERHPWTTGVTDADLVAQYEFSSRVRDRVSDANDAVIAIRRVKAQLEDRFAKSDDSRLKNAGDRLVANASAVEENIYQVRNRSNQDPLNFPIKVNNRLANLLSMAENGDGPPGNNMHEIFEILSTELAGYLDSLDDVWATDLSAVNAELERLRLVPLDPRCDNAAGCTTMQ